MDSRQETDTFMDENDEQLKNGRSKKDTSEYSSSLAPETRREAARESRRGDDRVVPGSLAGTKAATGAPQLEREDVPSRADDPGFTNYGESGSGAEEKEEEKAGES